MPQGLHHQGVVDIIEIPFDVKVYGKVVVVKKNSGDFELLYHAHHGRVGTQSRHRETTAPTAFPSGA